MQNSTDRQSFSPPPISLSPSVARHCQQFNGFFPSSTRTPSPFLPHPRKRCLLTLSHASLDIGARLLWQKVNLAICSGEFTALLGDNGAGKTTLFQVLLGIKTLTQGNFYKSADLSIGYVPQLKMFEPKLPIRGRDLVALGLDGTEYGLGFFSHLFKKTSKTSVSPTPKNKILSKHHKNYLIEKAIDEVGGSHFAHAPLSELSGGEQQRMRIAQALVAEPALLLLDEPLLSLDATSQAIVCDILAHRKQVHGTAILMISHEIVPILPMLDKVVWLHDHTTNTYLPQDFFAQNTPFSHILLPSSLSAVNHHKPRPNFVATGSPIKSSAIGAK